MNILNLREKKLYSKLSEEHNLRKAAELLYIFSTTPDKVEKNVEMMQSSSSYSCLCHYNIKVWSRIETD